MILLTLAWSLLTASQASDVTVILQREKSAVLYPKLLSNETVPCDCGALLCDTVYWFRAVPAAGRAQYLGRINNAKVVVHGSGVNAARFEFRRKTRNFYLLKINGVTEEDAGVYSCVLRDRSVTEVWKTGTLLLPGVAPPTSPPPTTTTKKPVRTSCRCSPRGGCGSLVLWPLVGTMAALALALICTLYYFSRLPKKCRHHFTKRRMT